MSVNSIDWDRLKDRVAALDDDAKALLVAHLADSLKLLAPVRPETRRARAALKAGEEPDAALVEALEALRDELDDEYFRLDAAEDEEAPAWFGQARAVGALVFALQGLHAEAVYETGYAVDDAAALLGELGLGEARA